MVSVNTFSEYKMNHHHSIFPHHHIMIFDSQKKWFQFELVNFFSTFKYNQFNQVANTQKVIIEKKRER